MLQRVTRLFVLVLVLPGLLLVEGCASTGRRHRLEETAAVHKEVGKSPFLNAHMRDGSFVALTEWEVDASGTKVSGAGRRLDVNRRQAYVGELTIPIDSVVVFEAASLTEMPAAMQVLTVVLIVAAVLGAVVLIAFAIACAGNPKCFGSCPTFYATDGTKRILQAEGFSASIAPSLEATDIDALYRARPAGRDFEITMTNEALETHCVRSLHVLAARRPPGGRVFASTAGGFRAAPELRAPLRATGPEGDFLAAVREFDGLERTSTVDSTDLAARETLDLEFNATPGESLGLVIASRQTLLTTYLFYETLAAMGGSVGSWIATLERGDSTTRRRAAGFGHELGGVEVLAEGGDGWRKVAEFSETGPLATDVRVIPLPLDLSRPGRLRLRMARGHYRLDWLALARLGGAVEPIRLAPRSARRDSIDAPAALAALLDSGQVLTTGPGDRYTFSYRLPGDPGDHELFLESRGWYMEWMRQAWIDSEDPMRLARMMLSPRDALRELAPAYAREQAELEDWFWRSRYARP